MVHYILYKAPIHLETIHIVQYLHSLGINIWPQYCIERNHPAWVSSLPTIETADGTRYIGLDACIQFFESETGIHDLLQKATEFKRINPEYRINRF